jgi:RNA polymerase sigma factor (sigma-70 family)
MNSSDVYRQMEAIPEERRLVRQAKSGDADAFVQLFDAYGDDVFRYVYFRVINGVASEDITSQVFRHAWEHLESFQKDGSSFVTWIYKIARNQVMDYYKANLKTQAFDIGFLSAAIDYGMNKEGQDLFNLEALRNHLQFLTSDKQQTLITKFFNSRATHNNFASGMSKFEGYVLPVQMRTLQSVAKYLNDQYRDRKVKPSPTFNAYTRSWLTQYLQFHAHRPKKPSMFWRMSLSYTVLIAALLVTGTAKAQSALPGDILYGWKRTSEQAWRSLSPDPVGTDIILADRRLNEWIAVGNDPARSANASNDYFDALTKLNSTGDAVTRVRILPVLKTHRERLNDSGLSTTQLDNYLTVLANPIPSITSTQIPPADLVPPATEVPIEVAPPATKVPIEVAPPATEVPPEVAPPATEAPTEVVAPATEAPIEVAPPTTEAPTEAAPAATDVPPDIAPPVVVPSENPVTAPTGTVP